MKNLTFLIYLFFITFTIFSNSNLYSQSVNLTMDWTENKANFKSGSIQQITWENSGVENIKIEYTTDDEKSWILIENSYPAATGFYNWVIPNTPSIYCRVRITDISNQNIYSVHPTVTKYEYTDLDLFYHFTIYAENKWEIVKIAANEPLTNIKFFDKDNGISWGNNILLVTDDGGSTWEIQSEFKSKKAVFIDKNNGWIIVEHYEGKDTAVVMHTNDGGQNWELQFILNTEVYESTYFYNMNYINTIHFVNENDGWLVTNFYEYGGVSHVVDFSTIYKTNDGGKTWIKNERLDYNIFDISFFDNTNGWSRAEEGVINPMCGWGMCGQVDSYLFNSSDSGKTWKTVNFSEPFKASSKDAIFSHSAYYLNPALGWACVGNWEDRNANSSFQNVYLVSLKDSSSNVLFKSTNRFITKLYFQSENVGWSFGYSISYMFCSDQPQCNFKSFINMTTDGGKTWEVQQFGEDFKISEFFSLDGTTCWAVGDSGQILKYTNLQLNKVNYVLSASTVSDTNSFVITNGSFYEGQSSTFNTSNFNNLTDIVKNYINIFDGTKLSFDKNSINENISLDIRLKGIDTASFGKINNPIDPANPLFIFMGIQVTGEQSGITPFNEHYYFNDGKKARICIPRTEGFLNMLETLGINDDDISFAYIDGLEYLTEGLEWEIKSGNEGEVDSLCLYLNHFSTIVGGRNFTITSINNNENNFPTEFQLEQNYPNPFNPSTKIKYSIPSSVKSETSNVKLIVYDVLGKEVATLVNETKSPGNYEVTFDASNIAAGVYYYQLKTGNFVQTKKMVLLK